MQANYTNFFEIGRVCYINYGEDEGKLCTIIDIIDQNWVSLATYGVLCDNRFLICFGARLVCVARQTLISACCSMLLHRRW